jgi:hypothetical protein
VIPFGSMLGSSGKSKAGQNGMTHRFFDKGSQILAVQDRSPDVHTGFLFLPVAVFTGTLVRKSLTSATFASFAFGSIVVVVVEGSGSDGIRIV